jgi:2,3-bisphosphoglycerate-dependent phosphoglycerate mutase
MADTLRALVKYMEGISDENIPDLEIPAGIPLVYELNERLQPVERYNLGDSSVAAQAQEALNAATTSNG